MTDSPPPVLPVEIWTQIHALACTDGGFAGRTLSLVSKDWRTISAPFKLQSISLVGPKPILRFVSLLDSTPDSVCNVQSLFIGCQNLRLYPSSSRLDLADERARGLFYTDKLFQELGMTSLTQTFQISKEAIDKAVVRILQLTCKTLHTLHTHLTLLDRPAPLYHVPLPQLRTLVLHGPFASPLVPSATLSPIVPKLRRLRLATPLTSPIRGPALLNAVATAAPKLSHLFLQHSACKHKDLERALERTNLRKLTRLVVEVGPARNRSPPFNATAESQEHAGLLQLAQHDGRVRIVRERRGWVDVQAALLEWEEADELQWDARDSMERDVE